MEAHNKWRMKARVLGPASLNVFINDLEETIDIVSYTLQMTPNWGKSQDTQRQGHHLEGSHQAGGMGQREHDEIR